MKTSQAGINLIKKFEGCRLKAYKLAGEKYYTIGVGHSFDPSITADTVWTAAQADAALRVDLEKFEGYVNKYVKIPLNQNQFDALVSYAYNRGTGGLKQLATASKTAADYADNIVKYWGSAERYKAGLIRRRKAERELFLKAADGTVYPEPMSTLKTGSKGDGVKWVQDALVKRGYVLSIDGDFGEKTRIAVVNFQELNGLEADGIVGIATRTALKS